MPSHSGDVPLNVVQPARPAVRHRPVVQSPWLFAAWMGGSALVAVVAGLVLGTLAASETLLGSDHWSQAVQAHGRLQLFGFAAAFVVALGMEFLPRLNQRPMLPRAVRVALPSALAGGALLTAAAQVWNETAWVLAAPGAVLLLTGAAGFSAVTWYIKGPRPLAIDPQPLFPRSAALWLVASAALSAWALAGATDGVVSPARSHMASETFLRGFITLMIVGIGLRAFVGHLHLQPLSMRQQLILVGGFNLSLLLWLGGQGLGPLPSQDWLIRAGDAGHALTLLLVVRWFGLLPRLWRAPRQPRYEWFIPLAWLGLLVYAAMLLGSAVGFAPGDLDAYQEGAIRHTFLLAFMIPLMVAMSHIVLARFALGKAPWPQALDLASVLVFVSWPLRVLPALSEGARSSLEKASMGLAGLVLMAGLGLVAAVCLRTVWLVRKR